MSTSTTEQRTGILIPSWAAGVVVGGILAVSGWIGSTLLELRQENTLLGERVRVLEIARADDKGIPRELAEVRVEIAGMRSELTALREDLRRLRPTATTERVH
jgi:hypothetical protein